MEEKSSEKKVMEEAAKQQMRRDHADAPKKEEKKPEEKPSVSTVKSEEKETSKTAAEPAETKSGSEKKDQTEKPLTEVQQQYYDTMKRYILCCVHKDSSDLSEKEREGLTPEEIRKRKEELKEKREKYESNREVANAVYESMIRSIQEKGTLALSDFTEAILRLGDEKEYRNDLLNVIDRDAVVKLYKLTEENFPQVYPLLQKINVGLKTGNIPSLSLSPGTALYGSQIRRSKDSVSKKAPLSNEEIEKMIEGLLAVKDYQAFDEWVTAVLMFDPERTVDVFQEEVNPGRRDLVTWLNKKILENKTYQYAVCTELFEKGNFQKIVHTAQRAATLTDEAKKLQRDNNALKEDYDQRIAKQLEIINKSSAELEALRKKAVELDRCEDQLAESKKRYQAQINMNERLTIENERRLQEIQEENVRLRAAEKEAESQQVVLQGELSDLKTDYEMQKNQLMRMQESQQNQASAAGGEFMKKLLSGISERLYDLNMFYLDLKDTGRLEPDSVDLFHDTLHEIDTALAGLGAEKIGEMDQTVPYDPTVHSPAEGRLSPGEEVVISVPGWKINGNVFLKAQVEKNQ